MHHPITRRRGECITPAIDDANVRRVLVNSLLSYVVILTVEPGVDETVRSLLIDRGY